MLANALLYFLLFCFEFKWLHLRFIRHERPEWMTKSKKNCSMFKTSNNFLVFAQEIPYFSTSMDVTISSVNSRCWFLFFRKCLKWQSLYLHMVQVFTKAQRSVHSTYNIDFVISNKYWTWLSNYLYHQLSYKVITACNNSCFLTNVIIHWNSKKKTSIIQDERRQLSKLSVILIGVCFIDNIFRGLMFVHSHLWRSRLTLCIWWQHICIETCA